jgi:hypothetical protein
MEDLLRTRKLSSASARKRKMEERQAKVRESKQRSMQKRDTNAFRFGYGYCSDEEELSDSESNHNTFSPIAEGELDQPTANASPSTASVRTPDDLPSPPYVEEMQAWPDIDMRVANVEDSTGECSTKLDISMEGSNDLDVPTPTPVKPIFKSTLNSRADFSFDFYSPEFSLDESLDPDLDLDTLEIDTPELDPDTPIEIATSVLYSQPRSRPYMISISVKNPAPSITSPKSGTRPSISSLQPAYSPPRSSKRPSVISSHYTSSSITSRKSILQYPSASPRSLTRPATYGKRMSNTSVMSGYPACEATPVFAPPPILPLGPEMLSNSSQESLLEGMEDRKISSFPKKPSMINSLRKSGLNNIMSYVKTPSRENVQSRPTTANRETEKETRARAYSPFPPSRDDYPAPLRPRTATAGSTRSWGENSVTALPTRPEPPMPSVTKAATFEVTRKKSFSALRNRSTTLGKALRAASSSVVPTTTATLYPNKSSISVSSSETHSGSQSRKASMDLASFPIPPSPLSRNYPRLLPSLERSGFAW